MAPAANSCQQNPFGMAQSGEPHPEPEHRRDHPGPDRRRHISPEQKELIRALRSKGLTGWEIAKRMGFGHSAIYRHLSLGSKGSPTWTDDEIQILVDGYLEKMPTKEIASRVGRSPRAVMVRMCRYRKQVRKDPKKRRVLGAMTLVLRAMRKADIFREVTE